MTLPFPLQVYENTVKRRQMLITTSPDDTADYLVWHTEKLMKKSD